MTVAVYATTTDLALVGLSAALYTGNAAIGNTTIADLLAVRSEFADDYIAQFYKLPLVAPYPGALRTAVAQLVAWDVMCLVGHDPDAAGTAIWRDRRDEAMTTLDRIAKHGSPGIVDSTPTKKESAPYCVSETQRGWGM